MSGVDYNNSEEKEKEKAALNKLGFHFYTWLFLLFRTQNSMKQMFPGEFYLLCLLSSAKGSEKELFFA
jgi:hypothetical protein